MKGLDYLYIVLLMLGSYLFANINFAKIISKCKKRDITKEGSGNPGTLNMLRTFGFCWAILNMVLEILKGVLPSLVGYLLYGDVGLYLCGLSAILGHIYPVIYKFKGGKGVACTAGMFFVANWWITLIVLVVCFTFVTLTSLGSVGTLSFVLINAIIQLCLIDPSNWICYVVIGLAVAIVFFAHRRNIVRLFQGKENPTNIRGAFKKDMSKLKSRGKDNNEVVNKNDSKNVAAYIDANEEESKSEQTEQSNIDNEEQTLSENNQNQIEHDQ